VSVMGCGRTRNLGKLLRICVGVCACRFSASICVQCGCAVVLAQVGGIERLFLRRDRRLRTEAIVMLCEPSMESHVCEKHSEKNARDF
jgi:hypothetical protein